MAQFRSAAPLPRGFSVHQPQLGAQLQFFPALGSRELDDMINAYIPGSAALKEKRATVSLDFLEHTQLTGQTFKFYTVSPVAASPAISTSSFSNTSPVNSTWDWSQASASPAVSSRSSSSKTRKASQYSTPDLSHLPGMKIMTKDGQDVTDSASRGSKTKEQRDHAHLMRIIKACDSCKRKKIRCDPSHKKRTAAQPQPQSAAKQAKKARTAAAAAVAAVAVAAAPPPQKSTSVVALSRGQDDNPDIPMSMFGIDPTFTFAGLDSFESNDQTYESWEEFIQYPVDVADESYDFFLDPEGYLSSQSSASSSSASPPKAFTPASQQDQDLQASFGLEEREAFSSESTSPELPFLQDNHTGLNNYTDFSLFSPSSSFSEDDRMLSISSSRTLSPTQPSASESDSFVYGGFDVEDYGLATGGSGSSELVSPDGGTGLAAAAGTSLPWYDPGPIPGDSRAQDSRAGISITRPAGWVGDVRIAYSPGGSVLVTATSASGAEVIANSAFANSAPLAQLDTSRSGSIAIAITGRDTSGEFITSHATSTALQFGGETQDELQSYGHSPTERGRLRIETPVGDSARLFGEQAVFRTETTSDQANASPSTLASSANHSVQYSTGSVESSLMAHSEQTENIINSGMSREVSPSGLQLSFGTTSDALLLGSTAFTNAGEDTTTDSPQASLATILEQPRILATGTNGGGISQAALRSGEAESQQQAAAPIAEDGTQPTSLLLLQASSPKRNATSDDGADFGMERSFNRWIGVQALAQAALVVLIGILTATLLACLMASSAAFRLASLAPAMGACFQRFAAVDDDFKPVGTTPSTTSSSRSQPLVLRRDFSRFSSHFFSSPSVSPLRRGMTLRFGVASLMG